MEDQTLAVRMRAAWSLGNLSDTLVANKWVVYQLWVFIQLVSHLHLTFTACSLRLPCIFTVPSTHLHLTFTTPSLYLHHIFAAPSPHLHRNFTASSPRLHRTFTAFSLRLHRIFATLLPHLAKIRNVAPPGCIANGFYIPWFSTVYFPRSSQDSTFIEDFSDMLLLRLLELAIKASEDHEKVRCHSRTRFFVSGKHLPIGSVPWRHQVLWLIGRISCCDWLNGCQNFIPKP